MHPAAQFFNVQDLPSMPVNHPMAVGTERHQVGFGIHGAVNLRDRAHVMYFDEPPR